MGQEVLAVAFLQAEPFQKAGRGSPGVPAKAFNAAAWRFARFALPKLKRPGVEGVNPVNPELQN